MCGPHDSCVQHFRITLSREEFLPLRQKRLHSLAFHPFGTQLEELKDPLKSRAVRLGLFTVIGQGLPQFR